ncbi:unnamed protein product [Closterium sp. NIES-53]
MPKKNPKSKRAAAKSAAQRAEDDEPPSLSIATVARAASEAVAADLMSAAESMSADRLRADGVISALPAISVSGGAAAVSAANDGAGVAIAVGGRSRSLSVSPAGSPSAASAAAGTGFTAKSNLAAKASLTPSPGSAGGGGGGGGSSGGTGRKLRVGRQRSWLPRGSPSAAQAASSSSPFTSAPWSMCRFRLTTLLEIAFSFLLLFVTLLLHRNGCLSPSSPAFPLCWRNLGVSLPPSLRQSLPPPLAQGEGRGGVRGGGEGMGGRGEHGGMQGVAEGMGGRGGRGGSANTLREEGDASLLRVLMPGNGGSSGGSRGEGGRGRGGMGGAQAAAAAALMGRGGEEGRGSGEGEISSGGSDGGQGGEGKGAESQQLATGEGPTTGSERGGGEWGGGSQGERGGEGEGEAQHGGRKGGDEWVLRPDEKFMWFASHGGFGNQVIQLVWGLRLAGLLNRTLIIPPKLSHFAKSSGIGRCDRNPTKPDRTRHDAWGHYSDMMRGGKGYVSMADVLDFKTLPPAFIRTIDLRHFAARFCHCDVAPACYGGGCRQLTHGRHHDPHSRKDDKCMWECGAKLGAQGGASKKWRKEGVLYPVDNTCKDTLWTIGNYASLKDLVAAVGEKEPAVPAFAHINVKHNRNEPVPLNVFSTLGDSSPAKDSKVLAFPSLFHPRIADINLEWDDRVQAIREAPVSMPFTPPIMDLARDFIYNSIGRPFGCMQVRGTDGMFVKALKNTLKDAEATLKEMLKRNPRAHAPPLKFPLFLMTDIPKGSWKGTFLEHLREFPVELYTVDGIMDRVNAAARTILTEEIGLYANRGQSYATGNGVANMGDGAGVAGAGGGGGGGKGGMQIGPQTPVRQRRRRLAAAEKREVERSAHRLEGGRRLEEQEDQTGRRRLAEGGGEEGGKRAEELEDIVLFVEQAICCHATLGTFTTFKSTAGSLVHALRRAGNCVVEEEAFKRQGGRR